MTLALYRYRLRCKRGPFAFREGLLLRKGEGWGEIAPLPGWSHETLEEALEELLSLLPHLESATSYLPSVRFGIHCALQPFPQNPIRCPLSGLYIKPPLPSHPTMKVKVGHWSVAEAIERVRPWVAHRRLRLDANRMWTLEQALAFADHFHPKDFDYFEEPVSRFEDLITFSKETQFPIAVDESFRDSPWQEIPSLKAVVIKPTLFGSIPPIPSGIQRVISSSYESGIGLLHLASHVDPSIPAGLDTSQVFAQDLLTSPIRTEKGFLSWAPYSSKTPPLDTSLLCPIPIAL